MKRLLVPLLGDAGDRAALDLGTAIARRNGGHIEAVLFLRDPNDMIPLVGDGFNAGMVDSIVEAGQAQSEEREAAARATFAGWQEAAAPSLEPGPGRLSASFTSVTGPLPNGIARLARTADMTILARTEPEDGQERGGLIETALFEGGRPVVLAGPLGGGEVGRRIVIAWNGSAEAARAVSMSMPMLQAADSVKVIVVDDGDAPEAPDELVRTLSLWGIAATGATVAVSKEGISATLEAEARHTDADLIVLGAYSHSRIREFVMGGVTDDALRDASLAVLLAR